MSSVLKFKKGRAAAQADPPADETARDVLPPPEPALLDWATLTPPPDDSHLAPCPQCGAPNGLSAASCWSCETNLMALEPFRRRRERGPARAEESIPVLTSTFEDNDATAQLPIAGVPASAPVSVPETAGRGHRWATGGSILVVAVLAVAAFVYIDVPAPPGAAKSGGSVDAPAPAPLMEARPAPTAPAAPVDPAGVSKAPPAGPETRTAALRALAVEPEPPTAAPTAPAAPAVAPAATAIDVAIPPSATPPAATATFKAARAGKVRKASRSPTAAPELEAPQPVRPAPSRQAPLPARPCTATVAALGLCGAPTESKE